MGGESAYSLQRCSTDTNLKVSSLPKSPRSRRVKSVTAANLSSANGSGAAGAAGLPRKRRSKDKVDIVSSSFAEIPGSPPSDSSKRKHKLGGGNRSLNKESIIPEDESLVPEQSPDMNWGATSTSKTPREGQEGSSSTATTMDSSGGSMDSSGRRRRKEKPDMDWGSHARKNNSNHNKQGGGKKSNSDHHRDSNMGGRGSGHHRKKEAGVKKSGSGREFGRHGGHNGNKKRDALSTSTRGGSGHNSRRVSIRQKQGMRKSLSGSSLRTNGRKSMSKTTSLNDFAEAKSPKKNETTMSPLLQVIAMDASYHSPTSRKNAAWPTDSEPSSESSKLKSFEEMVKIVKLHQDSGESSGEEEEDEDEEGVVEFEEASDEEEEEEEQDEHQHGDEDGSDDEKRKHRQRMSRKKRPRTKRTQSGDGGRRRQSKQGRRPNRSQTMDDVSATRRRHRRGHDDVQVPGTPKSGRKARAQSMIVRSPLSDNQEETRESRREKSRRSQRISIHEATGLVTPKRQSRRSVSAANTTDTGLVTARRQSRQQPAFPSSLDLGYGDDGNHSAGDQATSNRQRSRSRRASLGSGLFEDDNRSQQKEGKRRNRGMSSRNDDTLNGLITPKRPSRKLALPSPFDVEDDEQYAGIHGQVTEHRPGRRESLGFREDTSQANTDNDASNNQRMQSQSEYGDRTRTGRQRRNRGSILLFDDDDEEQEDEPMDRSARGRRGHRQDPLNVSRRRRELSQRGSVSSAKPEGRTEDNSMDRSQSGRRRGSSRRSVHDNDGAGRRVSRSLRGLEKLPGDEDDDDDDKDPELKESGSIGAKSLPELGRRGRRRDAVDDAAVGRRSSSSNSRTGRYGYGGDEGRLCLSAVPSTPKKTIGLAALLYMKPLDLGKDEKEEEAKSTNSAPAVVDESRDESGSRVFVADVDVEEESDKHPVDKVQAKKDYWKAKLAGGKPPAAEGSDRDHRSMLLA